MILPVAYIVIYEDNKFLLTQRKADHEDNPAYDGKWQLPGGGLEIGEHIRETIKREAREEIGIDIEVKRTLALTHNLTDGADWHGIAMAFLCKRLNTAQEIKVNGESYGHGWYTLQDALKLNLMPSMADILEYIVMSYRLFKIGTVTVIKKENQYLMTKVHAPHKPKAHDKWGFVMGTCDLYESLESAVVREAKEESGLDVRIVKSIPYMVEMYDLKLFTYLVEVIDANQTVTLNHEASDHRWMTQAEILSTAQDDMYGDTQMIAKLIS